MERGLVVGMVAVALAACGEGGGGPARTPAPPADGPAVLAEPASAPASAVPSAPTSGRSRTGMAGDLDLTGTEPFWGLRIRRDSLVLSRPDHVDVLAANPGPALQAGQARWGSVSAASGEPLRIEVREAACSDGMSDTAYPYTATVRLAGETLRGCARTSPH